MKPTKNDKESGESQYASIFKRENEIKMCNESCDQGTNYSKDCLKHRVCALN